MRRGCRSLHLKKKSKLYAIFINIEFKHAIKTLNLNMPYKNIEFNLLQVFVGEQADAALQAAALDRNPGDF